MSNPVNHPDHYGGADDVYEVIKVIRAWEQRNPHLRFNLGNTIKYVARAGLKEPDKLLQDLEKALFYLQDEIAFLHAKSNRNVKEGP